MARPKSLPTVKLEGLGLCEHCSELVTLEGLPSGALNAELKCPQCHKSMGHRSFGYKKASGKGGKVVWVGPKGMWVKKRPAKDFELNGLYVSVQRFPKPWY